MAELPKRKQTARETGARGGTAARDRDHRAGSASGQTRRERAAAGEDDGDALEYVRRD